MKHILKFLTVAVLALSFMTITNCASTSKNEGAGEYVDDSVITTKIKSKLLGEPNLSSAQINVKTYKGVVQLSGFVKSQADINKAEAIARGTEGVTDVKNDMHLR